MRILLVVNTKKYLYHQDMMRMFKESLSPYGEIQALDMAEQKALHEAFYKIRGSGCNVLITFDCAGFELRTENDVPAYNILGCRMAHILFGAMEEYREELTQQMNFSCFLFSMHEEDVAVIKERYLNIPNPGWMERIEYKQQGADAEKKNKEIIARWFARFCQEAELLPCASGGSGL